jgi:imidazolonepropionase-like amidohydrolase
MMAHLPGYFWINPEDDIHMYELSAADAAETARKHVLVIPTASLADNLPADRKSRGLANQIRSLRLLKAAGVEFGIGADSFGSSARKEALYLSRLGVFSNLELLTLCCELTPRAVFPQRKIGFLKERYEASFLVLKENPLRDFGAVEEIAIRFKQGRLLAPANTR